MKFEKIDGAVWCPIHTKPRNEKKVYSVLKGEGIPAFLPLRKHINIQPVVRNGKTYCYKRELLVPMFSNYLFACITRKNLTDLRLSRSVVRVLPVNEFQEDGLLDELELISHLEDFAREEEVDVQNGLTKGKRVKFIGGKFEGWEGVIEDINGETGMVTINVSSVFASVKIQYPSIWCQIISEE